MKLIRRSELGGYKVRQVFRRSPLTPWALLAITLGTTIVLVLGALEEDGWPMVALVATGGLLTASALVKSIIEVHSSENWLLKDCGDVLLIKLGTESTTYSEGWTAALVERKEVARFALSESEYELELLRTQDHGSRLVKFRFLVIHLVDANTGDLFAALAEEGRQRRIKTGIHLSSNVTVPKPGVIQLLWESPLGAITPRLQAALTALETWETRLG